VSSSQDWFAITASALGKDAVESKDGFTILALPSKEDQNGLQSQKGNPGKASQPATDSQREFICWEYAGNTYWESKRL
jgi:ribonuclease P/MRP protein subunit RPP40